MSGSLLPAERERITAEQAHKTATAALFQASQSGDRGAIALAKDAAARAAEVAVQAKDKAAAAAPLPANQRPMDGKPAEARAGFEGDPSAGVLSRRYSIPAGGMRASVDEGQRLNDRAARGHDAKAEAMRVVTGALGDRGQKLLSGARALVSRDPELKAWLDRTGAINSAWMVRHLGEEALRRGIIR